MENKEEALKELTIISGKAAQMIDAAREAGMPDEEIAQAILVATNIVMITTNHPPHIGTLGLSIAGEIIFGALRLKLGAPLAPMPAQEM